MNLTREEIHSLVDTLPEQELPAAKRYLQFLYGVSSDPSLASLITAPWDDEPESPGEIEAVREAYEDVEEGAVVTDRDLDAILED